MSELLQDLVLDAVQPDDEPALREWFELERAAVAVDRPGHPPPCWVSHRARLATPWPGEPEHAWLARSGDSVLGVAALSLPMIDNRESALGAVVVAVGHRRRGVGGRLLAHLAEQATAARRVRLVGEIVEPLDAPGPAAAFAAAVGAREVLPSVRRLLTFPPDDDALAGMEAHAQRAAAGYDLVQWSGPTPERWLDDIAHLTGRMSTDAPLGDLAWEPEHHDAQRVRERDAMLATHGYRMTVTAARDAGGRLVAFTELTLNASLDDYAWQGNTLVDPAHRGRRLGLLVKLANLRLVRELHPDVRTISTLNATSNTHMIAINEEMGFRSSDRLAEWQLDLDAR